MKSVVVLGSGPEVRGGVSSMLEVCREHGLFERWDAVHLPTHRDGSTFSKAVLAAVSLVRFAAWLVRGRVGLVHAHIASGASFWRKLIFIGLARAFRVPYILHVHAGDFPEYYERLSPSGRATLRWLYGGAHSVVALSETSRPALLEAVPKARVHVVPNPVAIPPWQSRAHSDRPLALFLGIVRPEKGVYDLLAAWPHVMRELPQARLVFAGSGEIEHARAIAERLGIASSVEFPGWVGPQERTRLLGEAAALVLPSRFEALPMAVLEGMAAGLPIVATRVGAVAEAVGDAGILVSPGDAEALGRALVQALGDSPSRIAMGASGRLRASRTYSPDVVVPAIERLWAAVLPQAKRTTPRVNPLP